MILGLSANAVIVRRQSRELRKDIITDLDEVSTDLNELMTECGKDTMRQHAGQFEECQRGGE